MGRNIEYKAEALSVSVEVGVGQDYHSGFHIFPTLKDADKKGYRAHHRCLVRVKYRSYIKGTEGDAVVHVADYMTICA